MKKSLRKLLILTLILALSFTAIAQGQPRAKSQPQSFDIIIKAGTVYDGTGRAPVKTDVGIKGDRIAAVGNLSRATAPMIVDAKGLAVAHLRPPRQTEAGGFIAPNVFYSSLELIILAREHLIQSRLADEPLLFERSAIKICD